MGEVPAGARFCGMRWRGGEGRTRQDFNAKVDPRVRFAYKFPQSAVCGRCGAGVLVGSDRFSGCGRQALGGERPARLGRRRAGLRLDSWVRVKWRVERWPSG